MSEKQEGDFITAYDTEKKTSTQAKISKIRRSFTIAFTRLWIAGSVLSVTPAHAFRLVSSPLERSGEEEWVAAGQLQAGDHVRSIKGIVRLDSTFTKTVPPTPVISYELEGGLDYVVGEMPVVVAGICQLRSVVEAFDGNKAAFQNLIKGLNPLQRSALIEGIAEIADLTKRKDFIKAFVADAKFSQGIIADASLIKVFSNAKTISAGKKNVQTLQKLKLLQDDLDVYKNGTESLKNKTLYQHCEGISNNNPVGGHLPNKAIVQIPDANGVNHPFIKVTDASGNNVAINSLPINSHGVISVPPSHKIEIAQIVKNPNGTTKLPREFSKYNTKSILDGHTFFPNGMSYDDAIEQFASALSNPTRGTFSASFGQGFEAISESGMTFRWYENGGKIDSFFPKF